MLKKKFLNYKTKEDIEELKQFISNNPEGCKSFRYYSSRPFEVIKNHIHTILYYDENYECIGYGHLDFENDLVWLGIIVGDLYISKKFGNEIMDHLISLSKNNIHLTVDKENKRGINLYIKKNFSILEENKTNYLMILKKQ